MFNMSGGELIIILLIVLMFFGANSIPKIARTLGRGVRQIKDATQEIQRDIQNSASTEGENGMSQVMKDLQDPLIKLEDPLKSVKKTLEDSNK